MLFVVQMMLNLIVLAVAALVNALGMRGDMWVGAVGFLLLFALYNGYFIFLRMAFERTDARKAAAARAGDQARWVRTKIL